MSLRTFLLTTTCRMVWLQRVPPEDWESASNGPWVFALLRGHAENRLNPAKPWRQGNWRMDEPLAELYPA